MLRDTGPAPGMQGSIRLQSPGVTPRAVPLAFVIFPVLDLLSSKVYGILYFRNNKSFLILELYNTRHLAEEQDIFLSTAILASRVAE